MIRRWLLEHPAVVTGVVLGVGSIGLLLLHHKSITQTVRLWRMLRSLRTTEKSVQVVTSEDGWARVMPLLYREAQQDGAVGFDCEWVQVRGRRRPVALLQLASCSGLCVLVRLSHMKPNFPHTLRTLLEDKTILKVGVAPLEDSNYLAADYNLKVRGCVDLRYLVLQCHKSELCGEEDTLDGDKLPGGMGLNALSQKYLGHSLDKDWRVRASDWEADVLTKRQEKYAAEDALVGVHILVTLMKRLWVTSSLLLPFLPPTLWCHHLASAIHHACQTFTDVRFSSSSKQLDAGPTSTGRPAPVRIKPSSRAYSTRKGPLYHNCQLTAPDGESLCTCDPKKAHWYIEKGLGVLVSEDPLVVRLNFEPSGRPQIEREDGKFYLQERHNVCVVCGTGESYIRKNVVPHEYRKHFPDILKDHQSHDVVLLCLECHRQSTLHDTVLRNMLAKEFDAPIGTERDVKVTIDPYRKIVKNAAGALLRSRAKIPHKRVIELEDVVKNYFNVEEVNEKHLHDAANMDVKNWNEGYQAHGQKVYEAYEKIGLVKLEQRWRQHFLDIMKPQFMPNCWSVTHNTYKMKLKMSQYPLDHPERLKYKVILVGLEGNIDIPYGPQPSREVTPVHSTHNNRDKSPESLVPYSSLHCESGSTLETKGMRELESSAPKIIVIEETFSITNENIILHTNKENSDSTDAKLCKLGCMDSVINESVNTNFVTTVNQIDEGCKDNESTSSIINTLSSGETDIANKNIDALKSGDTDNTGEVIENSLPVRCGVKVEDDERKSFMSGELLENFDPQDLDIGDAPLDVVFQRMTKKKTDVDMSVYHDSKVERIQTTNSVFDILCEDVKARGEVLTHHSSDYTQ
ncbi:exonuclease 3'-5' domain-containing protein 2-like isoform X1 [Homarus americanus]|uniref:exonuclease 3'-5' domain-containing protein 2-like isoform X1 n=2 Tax=Homarus americanus TaxID=6706 RepID=UPI001C445276|nr:exonuclease 3'-5' domain-containing protein 2-like isoform X1 [Homarus americanus]XP_042229716.1 exonuclease 3'-5' domain-containing protein 2-like isoform X1 [Homarus americanus]